MSVNLVAPQLSGTYRSEWMLLIAEGPLLGVGQDGQTPLYIQIVIPGEAMSIPASPQKTFTSANHHNVVNCPTDWTINVQTSGPGRDPEYVYLRPLATNLPMVEIYALKDAPPITGLESCDKNLQFKGVLAYSMSLPKGQEPAQQLLVFQKGESYYQMWSSIQTGLANPTRFS